MNDINQSDIISLPGSQTIWANTLHVSRSSLNQELRHMKEKGYFDIKDNNLILLDLEALEMILYAFFKGINRCCALQMRLLCYN